MIRTRGSVRGFRFRAESHVGRWQRLVAPALLTLATVPGLSCGGDGAPQRDEDPPQVDEPRAQPAEREEAQVEHRAFVALEGEDAVAVVAGPPWRVIRRVSVPAGPHNVVASRDGRHVAVTSPPGEATTLLRAPGGRVTAEVPIPGGPHDADFNPVGTRLWVAAEDGQRLVKLSVASGEVVGERSATGPPHDLAVSPDGEELWVTLGRVPIVEVRSAEEGRLLERPDLGEAPHDLIFEPEGGRIWFSNWTSGRLTVADAEERDAADRVEAGRVPHHFAFGAGCLWVSDHADGYVARFDPGSPPDLVGRTNVGGELHHVAAAGRYILVAEHDRGELAVLSPRGEVRDRLRVGAGPHGVAAITVEDGEAVARGDQGGGRERCRR
jgi:hypothetical protein